jgi:hypothetical protein
VIELVFVFGLNCLVFILIIGLELEILSSVVVYEIQIDNRMTQNKEN